MTDASPAQEARKGLLSSMSGKVKEVAGAVIGMLLRRVFIGAAFVGYDALR